MSGTLDSQKAALTMAPRRGFIATLTLALILFVGLAVYFFFSSIFFAVTEVYDKVVVEAIIVAFAGGTAIELLAELNRGGRQSPLAKILERLPRKFRRHIDL